MNIDNAIFHELSRLKAKLDAGEELTEEEQAWANKVLAEVMELVQAFADALIEAFKPFVETMLKMTEEFNRRLKEVPVKYPTGVLVFGYMPAMTPLNPLGVVQLSPAQIVDHARLNRDEINRMPS